MCVCSSLQQPQWSKQSHCQEYCQSGPCSGRARAARRGGVWVAKPRGDHLALDPEAVVREGLGLSPRPPDGLHQLRVVQVRVDAAADLVADGGQHRGTVFRARIAAAHTLRRQDDIDGMGLARVHLVPADPLEVVQGAGGRVATLDEVPIRVTGLVEQAQERRATRGRAVRVVDHLVVVGLEGARHLVGADVEVHAPFDVVVGLLCSALANHPCYILMVLRHQIEEPLFHRDPGLFLEGIAPHRDSG